MMSKIIPLTQGKHAIVDDEDYEQLSRYRWYAHRDGNTFYAVSRIKGKQVLMHREILNVPEGTETDHRNGNGLDNWNANLRICTKQQNGFNSRKRLKTSSKYKGVCWDKRSRKWRAHIRCNGKQIHGGCFKNEEEAAEAYNAKARELFGDFAQLNHIGGGRG